jgi:hypothetical protein
MHKTLINIYLFDLNSYLFLIFTFWLKIINTWMLQITYRRKKNNPRDFIIQLKLLISGAFIHIILCMNDAVFTSYFLPPFSKISLLWQQWGFRRSVKATNKSRQFSKSSHQGIRSSALGMIALMPQSWGITGYAV